jgi:geranylgeranyl diphosphate synthase type II
MDRLSHREGHGMTDQGLSGFLEQLRGGVEARLARYLQRTDIPQRLLAAMRYSMLSPGKRIRPILAIAACQACAGQGEAALPAACAVEMVHTYSLIHDDLPAMDDDAVRRGQPTCHKKFDEATAILAGDALLTLAIETLARDIQPAELAAHCVLELAQAAGMAGMVGGQTDDILSTGRLDSTMAQLESIHRRKTGALLRAAVRLGAIIGLHGKPAEEANGKLEALTAFAMQLGLAFQISDDLLDVESDEATLGKTVHKDAAQGKLTYPGLLGNQEARVQLQAARQKGMAAIEAFGDTADVLRGLLKFVVERKR